MIKARKTVISDPNGLDKIEQFVEKETQEYDESHDAKHAHAVFKNALTIYETLDVFDLEEPDFSTMNVIIISALLHDVCDHKYEYAAEKYERMLKLIDEMASEKEKAVIIDIIENISFSTEAKGKMKDLGKYQILRDIVSDADKLEAIGKIGIERCRIYAENKWKDLSANEIEKLMRQHCYDKLLLLKDQYIRTKKGKEMAGPLHKEIEEYLENH